MVVLYWTRLLTLETQYVSISSASAFGIGASLPEPVCNRLFDYSYCSHNMEFQKGLQLCWLSEPLVRSSEEEASNSCAVAKTSSVFTRNLPLYSFKYWFDSVEKTLLRIFQLQQARNMTRALGALIT